METLILEHNEAEVLGGLPDVEALTLSDEAVDERFALLLKELELEGPALAEVDEDSLGRKEQVPGIVMAKVQALTDYNQAHH